MGKDVGAMGNDMQALKKHLDDVSREWAGKARIAVYPLNGYK